MSERSDRAQNPFRFGGPSFPDEHLHVRGLEAQDSTGSLSLPSSLHPNANTHMLRSIRLLPLAACLLAGSTLAQNPVFTYFGNNSRASDVVTLNGDVIVVGTNNLGNAFRWTSSTGVMTDLGPVRTNPDRGRS